jgi:hypothetical protein
MNRERHGMKYHKYSKEEQAYIKRLYNEGVNYADIKTRFAAEFGYDKLGDGVIYRLCKKRRRKQSEGVKRAIEAAKEKGIKKALRLVGVGPQPCYCAYCGHKLRG